MIKTFTPFPGLKFRQARRARDLETKDKSALTTIPLPQAGVYPFAPPGGSSSSHQEHEHMHNGGTM